VLCAHFEWNVALHVDTTTFGNGTCEISPESTEDVPEDQRNVTKGISEAPNQSSEDINISDFSPTSKGKPRTYPIILFILQSMPIYIISCIKSKNWGETLDAWILGTQCNAPESLSDRCSANRTGRSRVISCHSRDIGVACLHSCNHYKDDGQGHVLYHDLRFYPVCFDKSLKVGMCGSGG
jgi:hypothetical protein